jgi:rubredoxin
MTIYACTVCGFEYDEEVEGAVWSAVDAVWVCPVCGAEKSLYELKEATPDLPAAVEEDSNTWERSSDELEGWMKNIHEMATSGKSINEPMRTPLPVISWDDVLMKGAQLARLPLAHNADVKTQTVIGKNAKKTTRTGESDFSFAYVVRCPLERGKDGPSEGKCLGRNGNLFRRGWNFTGELKTFARLTGHETVHELGVSDLLPTNSEISNHTTIEHA